MVDIVGLAIDVRRKGRAFARPSGLFDSPDGLANARPVENLSRSRSMFSARPFCSIAKLPSPKRFVVVSDFVQSVPAYGPSSRFIPILHPQIVVANSYTYSGCNVG